MFYFISALALTVALNIELQVLLYWFVPMFFVLPLIGRIRSIGEHFAISYADAANSTREIRAGRLEKFLLAPHNVSFHLTHHQRPYVPFYNLAEVHEKLRLTGELKGAQINEAYLLPYENSVLRDMVEGPKRQDAA